jgi:radical SAM superfamily enzyme YgiQ (UPF0313 family)
VSSDFLRAVKPDVVALTGITENYERAISYARSVKRFNPKIKVIIGGVHISSVPESLSRFMDVGIVGEGEQTFLELLENNFEPASSINGLVYWKDDNLRMTPPRELIEPLDNIPHPMRNMYGSEPRQPYLFTSRGCTYRCVFCSSSRFWKKVRFHSAEYVAEEIRQLVRTGCKFINIYDDCFPLNLSRVKRIKDLIRGCDVKFAVAVRANLVTREMAAVFKEMNVTDVGMGLESNSPRILQYLQKGNTPEDNQRAVDILRAYSIHVHCSFIRDVPIETKEDLRLTYDFIKRNRLSYDMYRLMRLPNTPIYEGSTDWSKCKVKRFLPLKMRLRKTVSKFYHTIEKTKQYKMLCQPFRSALRFKRANPEKRETNPAFRRKQ